MANYLYIAYGSNLHFQQMRYRCPHCVYLGSGYLKNTELVFKGVHGGCFCTIQSGRKGKKTPIGIFLIDDEDLKALDRYEGFPTHYRRETVRPSKIDITEWLYNDIELTNCIVYIMNHGEYGAPSSRYLSVVCEGYKHCNLDLKYLREAYTVSMKRREKRKFENAKF